MFCAAHVVMRRAVLLLGAFASFSSRGRSQGINLAPNCRDFLCPAQQRPVVKLDHEPWSYGCANIAEKSGTPVISPLSKEQSVGMDKCCVERDVCHSTCGMTAKECFDIWSLCIDKACKDDLGCKSVASTTELLTQDPELQAIRKEASRKGGGLNVEEQRCKGYLKRQSEACDCVPEEEWDEAVEAKLKVFFQEHNPSKLDKDGEVRDIDEIRTKWHMQEPQLFLALAVKYKDKSVQIRQQMSDVLGGENPYDATRRREVASILSELEGMEL
eukprot:gnl/TRDRNA2_/TRDRNA2_155320_c0_seq1.p1 gnl/TRDRNA2_/TRDRNA2_155320_c0~~gnl/TRDRNA2_/TRDRNA2_155320_c0_seq1.p1  ORF type:complete len:272 (+),score=62.41 gnl/TRDRNA2_/TRDRNA2_155320_c0_seq1:46-861(+)